MDAQWQDRVLDLERRRSILMTSCSIGNLLITDYSSSVFEAAILELTDAVSTHLMRRNTWTAETFYFDYDAVYTGIRLSRNLRHYARKSAAMLENIVSASRTGRS
ncbi:MAG: hypothetical protein ACLVIY_00080 [Anaerobutyricum soehngenii]